MALINVWKNMSHSLDPFRAQANSFQTRVAQEQTLPPWKEALVRRFPQNFSLVPTVPNLHEFGHVQREIASRYIYARVLEQQPSDIHLIYPAVRDRAYFSHAFARAPQGPTPAVHFHRPIITPQDSVARNPDRMDFIPKRGDIPEKHVFVMIDVFWLTVATETVPFTPENLASLLVEMNIPLCGGYVSNRCFEGVLGGEEGVWYRSQDNMIHDRPDSGSAPYEPHPPTDWLLRPGAKAGYAWSSITPLSDASTFLSPNPNHKRVSRQIVSFVLTELADKFDDSPFGCFYCPLPTQSTGIWAEFVEKGLRILPTTCEQYLVDEQLFQHIAAKLVARAGSAYSQSQLLETTLAHVKSYVLGWSLCPFFLDIVTKHVAAAWHANLNAANSLAVTYQYNVPKMLDRKRLYSSGYDPKMSWWARYLYGAARVAGKVVVVGATAALLYMELRSFMRGARTLLRWSSKPGLKSFGGVDIGPLSTWDYRQRFYTMIALTPQIIVEHCLDMVSPVILSIAEAGEGKLTFPVHYWSSCIGEKSFLKGLMFHWCWNWLGANSRNPLASVVVQQLSGFLVKRTDSWLVMGLMPVLYAICNNPGSTTTSDAAAASGPCARLALWTGLILGTKRWWYPLIKKLWTWCSRRVPRPTLLSATAVYGQIDALPIHYIEHREVLPPTTYQAELNYMFDNFRPPSPVYGASRNDNEFYWFLVNNGAIRLTSRPTSKIPARDPNITEVVLGNCFDWDEDNRQTFLFLGPVFGPEKWRAPTRGFAATYHALTTRIGKPPPLDPVVQERAWEFMGTQFLIAAIPEINLGDDTTRWDDFVSHLPSKKRQLYTQTRAEALYASVDRRLPTECPVFLKGDEVLLKDGKDFKGRLIQNVPIEYQVLLGPWINVVTAHLKKFYGAATAEPHFFSGINGRACRFYYGPGMGPVDLMLVMANFLGNPQTVHFVCSGDDQVAFFSHNGTFYALSSDYSQYDQSQSRGPLGFELRLLATYGVPKNILDLLERTFSLPYVIKDRQTGDKVKWFHSKRPMRPTGGPDTTLGNTMINAAAWLSCFEKVNDLTDLMAVDRHLTQLGFATKLKITPFDDAEFLKGVWFHTDQGFVWGPLPSRIFKIKSWHVPNQNVEESVRNIILDQWASYSPFSWCPIYECLNYSKVGTVTIQKRDWDPMSQVMPFRPTGVDSDVLCRRYNCLASDISYDSPLGTACNAWDSVYTGPKDLIARIVAVDYNGTIDDAF